MLYGNKAILEDVKAGQCEDLKVYGSKKTVCVKDIMEQVPKNDQTLVSLKICFSRRPGLAPLTRRTDHGKNQKGAGYA